METEERRVPNAATDCSVKEEKKTMERIYIVTAVKPESHLPRLVRATKVSQVAKHIIAGRYIIEVASQQDIVNAFKDNPKIEVETVKAEE